MTASTPSVLGVRDQLVEVAESLDYEVVYSMSTPLWARRGGPTSCGRWSRRTCEILEFIGEPENLTGLTQAMDTAGWYPELIMVSPNFYDSKYQQEGGASPATP